MGRLNIWELMPASSFYDPSLSNIWFLISHWKPNKFLHALAFPFFSSLICPSFQIRISTHSDYSFYPASGGTNPLGMPSFRILSATCPSWPESMKSTSKATEWNLDSYIQNFRSEIHFQMIKSKYDYTLEFPVTARYSTVQITGI